MEIREKYDDLYNLIQNLKNTIHDTNFVEVQDELRQILNWAEDEFTTVDKELEEIELEESRQELNERYGEYWRSQF